MIQALELRAAGASFLQIGRHYPFQNLALSELSAKPWMN